MRFKRLKSWDKLKQIKGKYLPREYSMYLHKRKFSLNRKVLKYEKLLVNLEKRLDQYRLC